MGGRPVPNGEVRVMQAEDRDENSRTLEALADAIPLYERYLELARLAELPSSAEEEDAQVHVPAPLTLTIRTR